MTTVKVDNKKRVRLPDASPGQVFAYETNGEAILLRPVRVQASQRFPPGSLLKYFTPKRDREEAEIFKGCVQGPE